MSANFPHTTISSPCSSPCIGVCITDAHTGYCTGCGRTLDEITHWLDMSEDQRKSLMMCLSLRLNQAV